MTYDYDDKVRKTLGSQIRSIRMEKELSQEELALRAGIDRTYISSIERGLKNPSLPIIYRIAHELKVKPATLIVPVKGNPD
ncbi:helix-turn-helix domain-containing protein [Halobacillus seohaensis]|uniref:Helix-turn-helix domain-containing protein n=1 Tax=Halobacillus seohaensis TaxID=447421 RepID=A0ABW2EQA8_9BACI